MDSWVLESASSPETGPASPERGLTQEAVLVARTQLFALPWMSVVLAACTGLVGSPTGPGGPGDNLGGATGDGDLYPGTGRTGAHRLNNTEYDNTVRDLLGTDLKLA